MAQKGKPTKVKRSRAQSKCSSKSKCSKGKAGVLTPVIKPGTLYEYLWEHPEIVDQWWREHGVDLEEWEKLTLSGKWVTVTFRNGKIEFEAEED